MKKITHKTSARLRTPIVSNKSSNRVKAMRRVGVSQLSASNPLWYIDYKQTAIAEDTPIEATSVPQRKAVSWSVNGPANRAAWTSDGMAFAGAQSYIRGTGDDINGETQLTIISVTNATAAGQIVETNSSGFFNVRGIVQAVSATPVLIQSEGPVPTNVKNYETQFNEDQACGTYWDTANPVAANSLVASTNGQTAVQTSFTSNPKGTPFASNNLYIGSRSSSSLFFQGTMKAVLFYQGENNQKNLNELTSVARWSVK